MHMMKKFSADIFKIEWMKTVIGFILFLSALLLVENPVMADMVNINKANAEALQENLEGIGPVKAQAIVKYRKKNGSFKSIDDLKNVPGVGQEIMHKNKKSLSTSRGLEKAMQNKQRNTERKSAKQNLTDKAGTEDKKVRTDKKTMEDKAGKKSKKVKTDKKSLKNKAYKKSKADKKSMKDKAAKKSKKTKAEKRKKKIKADKKAKKAKKAKKSLKSKTDEKLKKEEKKG